MKKFLYRLAASIAVSLLIVCIVDASGFVTNGHRSDGLFYQASGIRPDAQLLTINGQTVEAEEYLYWLTYDCEYLSSYVSNLDFNAELSDGMTYGDYAKTDALETVKLYTVVRQLAEANGVTLTEEDRAALAQQREQYVAYYGSEEAYQLQIRGMGVSEEAFDRINEGYFLYARLYQSFCSADSALYPGQEALIDFAREKGYVTTLLLYWPLGGESDDNSRLAAEDFAQQLRQAEDISATYLELAAQLGMDDVTESGVTASAEDMGETLTAALSALAPGQVSDVIDTGSALYVAVGQELDVSVLMGALFEQQVQTACSEAQVVYNQKLYDKLSVSDFFTKLQQARQALS